MTPAGLHQPQPGIRDQIRNRLSQEIGWWNKISIEYCDKFTACALHSFSQSPSLKTGSIGSAHQRDVCSALAMILDARLRDLRRLVVRIVEHLDLQMFAMPVQRRRRV